MSLLSLPNRRPCWGLAAAVAGCLMVVAGAAPAHANTLQRAVESMAKNISDYLDEKGQRQIALQPFVGPSSSTAGRAIQSALKAELVKQNTTVERFGTNWTVRGSYSMESNSAGTIVLIKAELVDSQGKEISGFREKVQVEEVAAIEDISRLLGTTVDLTQEQTALAAAKKEATPAENASASDRSSEAKTQLTSVVNKAASERVIKNQTNVASTLAGSVIEPVFAFRNASNTVIAPSQDSDFRLEVMVKPAGASGFNAISVENEGGFPFAALTANDVYKLKVYNDTDHAVGVKVSIDGINSFALADDENIRELGTWFIPAKSFGVIPGWYINAQTAKEFLVTSSGEDLGLPNASDVGTVTVQFFNAWLEGEPQPEIELASTDRGQLRTGVGRDISRQGGFQRSFFGKVLLSSISVRYSNPDDLPE